MVFPFVVFNLLLSRTSILPGAHSFVISTGSMEPTLPVGSIVYTVRQSSYRVGEVIAFLKNKGTVSHRVVGSSTVGGEKYYETKGDSNSIKDIDLVHQTTIHGKVVAIVPIIGNIVLFYKNPFGILLGTVLPTLLFLLAKIIPYSY